MWKDVEIDYLRKLCQEQEREIDKLHIKLNKINDYLERLKKGKKE